MLTVKRGMVVGNRHALDTSQVSATRESPLVMTFAIGREKLADVTWILMTWRRSATFARCLHVIPHSEILAEMTRAATKGSSGR